MSSESPYTHQNKEVDFMEAVNILPEMQAQAASADEGISVLRVQRHNRVRIKREVS
jgi:hypothetical protein